MYIELYDFYICFSRTLLLGGICECFGTYLFRVFFIFFEIFGKDNKEFWQPNDKLVAFAYRSVFVMVLVLLYSLPGQATP